LDVSDGVDAEARDSRFHHFNDARYRRVRRVWLHFSDRCERPDLRGVHLTGAKNLIQTQLNEPCGNQEAELPGGLGLTLGC
jgi:hypothetical protein